MISRWSMMEINANWITLAWYKISWRFLAGKKWLRRIINVIFVGRNLKVKITWNFIWSNIIIGEKSFKIDIIKGVCFVQQSCVIFLNVLIWKMGVWKFKFTKTEMTKYSKKSQNQRRKKQARINIMLLGMITNLLH